MHQSNISDSMRHCIDECSACHGVCLETITHCLQTGGPHAKAGHIRTLLDCAEICQASANFMLRGSEMHARTCEACAEACDRCAKDCEQFAGDVSMQRCAEVCRRCAESCRQMARHG